MFSLTVDADTELRLHQPEDAAALFALIDANRDHLGRWFFWVDETTGVEHTRDFIRRGLERFGRADGFEAGIWHRGDLVGALGQHRLDRRDGDTELGYWLAASAQGRGLMTRSVAAVVDALFGGVPALERIEIRCWSENARSRAVPERLGFAHEGTLRHSSRRHGAHDEGGFVDHEVYALLRGEWAARQRARTARQSRQARQESA